MPKGADMSQAHAVCLQMVAKGIILMNVTDRTKVGTDKITRKNLAVTCPRAKRCVWTAMSAGVRDSLLMSYGRGSTCLVRKT